MTKVTSCPDDLLLQRLAAGRFDGSDSEPLLQHLEACDACAGKLASLPELDTLAEKLREETTPREGFSEETVRRLVDRLSKLSPDGSPFDADRTLPAKTWTLSLASKEISHEFLAPPQAPDELGRLGPYRVLAVLGAGGMGMVFRAEDPHLQRLVALKVMLPSLAARENARQRFLREARAAAAIKHDHIVTIYQVGESGVPFLAMEYLAGESLDARLRREGKLSTDETLRIGREIALGLAAAHRHGLIHRDIKPANIWLELPAHESTSPSRVKILDFGLARSVQSCVQLTQEGAILGTPAYMAPEQATGGNVDERADLFSFGCVLYRMATGRLPFERQDTISTLMAVASESPPSPREVDSDVPSALSTLVMRLLAKKSADRPPSARSVADELLQSTTSPNRDLATTTPRKATPSGRRRWLVFSSLLLLLLMGSAYLLGPLVLRLLTPTGELVLESADEEIEITVQQTGGKPVVIVLDKHSKRTLEVQALGGDIIARELPDGLRFKTQRFELTRGDKKVFSAELLLAAKTPSVEVNYALAFDGENSEVVIPSLANDEPGPRTIEAYATPRRIKPPVQNQQSVVALGGACTIGLRQYGDRWRCSAHSAKGTVSMSSSKAVQLDVPVHLAAVWDGEEVRLYVDGKLAAKDSQVFPVGRLPPGATIGAQAGMGRFPFAGVIDEVRISKVARYAKDFKPERRLKHDDDTFALYHCDEGGGEILKDSSGNGHHGTIKGAKWVKADGPPFMPYEAETAPGAHGLEFAGNDNVVLPNVGLNLARPYTVESWARIADAAGAEDDAMVMSGSGMTLGWLREKGVYRFHANSVGGAPPQIFSDDPVSKGIWVHLAAVSDGARRSFYVNGRRQKQVFNNKPSGDVETPLVLGAERSSNGTLRKFFSGALREVRISKVARYYRDFEPRERFEPDADTLALYHGDEGRGNMLKDYSGNRHHGKIEGAKWMKLDPVANSPPRNAHLIFDGKSRVELPTLDLSLSKAVTIEAFAEPSEQGRRVQNILSARPEFGLRLSKECTWQMFAIGSFVAQSKQQASPRRVHVAAVLADKEARLYVDGEFVHSQLIQRDALRNPEPGSLLLGRDFSGTLAEVRISRGIRYTQNFTPSARFDPDQDTLALYHCDEGQGDKLVDASGNGHDGKIWGAKWVASDYALEFDGDGVVTFDNAFNYSATSCTIEAYVRLDAHVPRGWVYSLSGNSGLGLNFEDGKRWRMSHVMNNPSGHFYAQSENPVELGRRIHLAGVLDQDRFTLFLDGKPVGKTPPVLDRTFTLGKSPPRIGVKFKGVIDEMRISSKPRYATTFTPRKRFESDADTIALYHFDEGLGDVLKDSSGNGHHGRIVGAKWVKADDAVNRKPFALMRSQIKKRTFENFSSVWQEHEDGDVIEVHGDGPFLLPNILLKNKSLTLRAAPGFRPRFLPVVTGNVWIAAQDGNLVLEGCDFMGRSPDLATTLGFLTARGEASIDVRNCRIMTNTLFGFQARKLTLSESLVQCGRLGILGAGAELKMSHCLVHCHGSLEVPAPGGQSIQLQNNSIMVLAGAGGGLVHPSGTAGEPCTVDTTSNLIHFGASLGHSLPLGGDWQGKLKVNWRGRNNHYVRLGTMVNGKLIMAPEIWTTLGIQEENPVVSDHVRFTWDSPHLEDAATALALLREQIEDARRATGVDAGPDVSLIGPGDPYVRALKASRKAALKLRPEPEAGGPFVLIRDGEVVRGYLTLAAALSQVRDGDTVEIRSDQPESIPIAPTVHGALTLRAAPGYIPSVATHLGIRGACTLTLEGLHLRKGLALDRQSTVAALVNCIFERSGSRVCVHAAFGRENGGAGELRNCLANGPISMLPSDKIRVINSIVRSMEEVESADTRKADPHLELERSFFFDGVPRTFWQSVFDAKASPRKWHFAARQVIFEASSAMVRGTDNRWSYTWQGECNIYRVAAAHWMLENWRTTRKSLETGSAEADVLLLDPAQWKLMSGNPGDQAGPNNPAIGADVSRVARVSP